MVNVVQNGEYKNIKLSHMLPNEVINAELLNNPYFGQGKYGQYVSLKLAYNGEEVSLLVGEKTRGGFDKTHRLIDDLQELGEGDRISITKVQEPAGKFVRTYYLVQRLDEVKTSEPTKEQVNQPTNKPTLTLGVKKEQKSKFSEEEEDLIKQLTGVVNSYEHDVLINSIIDSFRNVGKDISNERAEEILKEAERRVKG